jgi:AdoMet-dependent heme synthase
MKGIRIGVHMYYTLSENSFLKVKPTEKMLSVMIKGYRGDVVINESAFEILKLCDGSNTIEDIYEKLGDIYTNPKQYTDDFLEQYMKNKIVEKIDKASNKSIVKGDPDVYYPDVIIWEITKKCPLRCVHCYLGKKNGIECSKDEIDQVISIIKDTGVTAVQLTGGEIFTHPYIDYIIDQLNLYDIPIALSTTGYLLDEKIKNILRALKKTAVVRVSLDGDENTHNNIRQNNQAYQKSIEFIQFLKQENIACQVATTHISQSESEIKELIKTVRDLGVSIIEISNVLEQGDAASNNKKSRYSQEELNRKLYEWYDEFATETFKVKLPGQESILHNCGSGYKLIYITADFNITPCPMIPSKIGSLKNMNYHNIMESGTKLFMDIISPKEKVQKICDDCLINDDCGSCIAMALIKEDMTNNCLWVKKNKHRIEQLAR